MYHGKTISVAIAAYNGAQYIMQQLESILLQTVQPDEIIVSDDASGDGTPELLQKFACSRNLEGTPVSVRILTDNPRHGHCGNFDWASRHTAGDYIFFCDQDDIWEPNKVEAVLDCFSRHPDASAVFHNAYLIDAAGQRLERPFEHLTDLSKARPVGGTDYKLDRDSFGEAAAANTIARGMTLCVTRELLTASLPFPGQYHDHWLCCSAALYDGLYYLNLPLTAYRVHALQTCGVPYYRKSSNWRKLKHFSSHIKSHVSAGLPFLSFGRAVLHLSDILGLSVPDIRATARGIESLGSSLSNTFWNKGLVSGIRALLALHRDNPRYRRMGQSVFLGDLVAIIMIPRSKRRKLMEARSRILPYTEEYAP